MAVKTELDLQCHYIDDDGAAQVGAALEKNTRLTTLDLGNNSIGDDGAAQLGAALEKNATLTKLGLFGNEIGDEGAARLGAALEKNATLTELDLQCNEISEDGAARLLMSLEKNATLTKLWLFRNNHIGHLLLTMIYGDFLTDEMIALRARRLAVQMALRSIVCLLAIASFPSRRASSQSVVRDLPLKAMNEGTVLRRVASFLRPDYETRTFQVVTSFKS